MSDSVKSLALKTAAERLRVPPHSIEAEQAVLGGLMLDNEAWYRVSDRIQEADFYRQDHRLIFRAIHDLLERGNPSDVVTVSEWLESRELLDDAGSMTYLGQLVQNTPSAANIKTYADIVRERSVLRQLISIGGKIAESGYAPDGRETRELLDSAEQMVFQIAEQGARGRQGFTPINDLLKAAVDKIDTLYRQNEPITGLATGYIDFDRLTSGLQKSDLIIVAGRPSMGKTTFAMNIAESAAISSKKPVAVFSMEMPGEQLVMRMIASLGRVNQTRVRTGQMEEDDWPRITSAISLLSEAPLFIDDSPALAPSDLRARARRLVREHGELGLIVVDYLQLMQIPGNSEGRVAEISEISRGLKALAKELTVPVIALSQLNRSLEQRSDKRPVMSDLRESGAIEQDADLIVFIYRDEVYNQETAEKGKAEIIIAKQRNGPIDTVRLTFLGEFTRFENYTADSYQH